MSDRIKGKGSEPSGPCFPAKAKKHTWELQREVGKGTSRITRFYRCKYKDADMMTVETTGGGGRNSG